MNNYYLKIIFNKISIITIVFCIISCTKLEKTIPNDLLNNSEKYNEIMKTIYKSDFSRFSLNQFISQEYFPKELNELLKTTKLENKVDYLIFFKNTECKQKSFELKSAGYYLLYSVYSKSSNHLVINNLLLQN